ncbi:hypothetical protein VVD49_01395 [Uliginosibacterium sp. H3]|uniref:DUF3302 domain-containing protein n=1 Tax=Uliginosibacterium silvisoli TaxID=3114758 RepID=A0ABU6JXK6_9RHOO|nr:hypothetical protein [Uliginosibacterium sp. H3]
MHIVIAAALLLALFAMNAWVTWRIRHDPLALPAEKLGQTLLVWTLPLLGTLLVLHLTHDKPAPSAGGYAEDIEPVETMEALQDGLTSNDWDAPLDPS